MTIDEFKQLEDACRVRKPSIFRLAFPDPPASNDQIAQVEAAINCRLPESYRQFLSLRGGGDYPLLSVFSANPDSDHYLPRRREEFRSQVGDNLLPIHDDQAGGLYVLRIAGDFAADEVYYFDWETRELSAPRYDSILDLIADQVFS